MKFETDYPSIKVRIVSYLIMPVLLLGYSIGAFLAIINILINKMRRINE